jgi:hypothetical protein
MYQEYLPSSRVYINRNNDGVVRELLHLDEPWVSNAPTPTLTASAYLATFGNLLNIQPTELSHISAKPSTDLTNDLNEYRLLSEKSVFDTTTFTLQQTYFGLPVWEAGVSVHIKNGPARVLSSQATSHTDIQVQRPDQEQVRRALAISETELATHLGVGQQTTSQFPLPKIDSRRLVIYQYRAGKRTSQPPTQVPGRPPANEPRLEDNGFRPAEGFSTASPTLPLPPPSPAIVEGQHYVGVAVYFQLPVDPYPTLNWVAILDVATLSVLYLRAFVDHVTGMVFQVDPVTTNGGPLPSASAPSLNAVRTSVTLPNLSPPNGTQALSGTIVKVSDVEAPTVAPPTETPGSDFDFDSRTNDFGAVNTYFHADSFFELLQSLGFDLATFFGSTTFPTPVDHRGLGGNVVNAHCLGTTDGSGILQTAFALADTTDTTNPICIGCDYRVVLHELAGHGVLYPHVHSPNLGFSHSAGDGVAAILNDPQTVAPDRFLTFPWIPAVSRRHDRDVASGWGYNGSIGLHPFDSTLDFGGYNNEQILSTSHFRLYRSMGGDSSTLSMRQFASRYAVYLIMRAISTLTPATNPPNAANWVTALIAADQGDWTSAGYTGGAYAKVIRWAFEKQGLYQLPGTATPNNLPGAPPAVDVYIDDGRGGEYPFQPAWWNNQSIWNRRNNDGGTTHEEPIYGVPNYAYVKIKNRGSQKATGVIVKAFHAEPGAGLDYPVDWHPMTTPQLSAADVPANNAGEITVGPFEWTPTELGHDCIFMVVSASGDASNTDNIAAGDTIPEWRLVPQDNNIGQRNVYPVAGGGGTHGLVSSFAGVKFRLRNPMASKAKMTVKPVLPAFLAERNWAVEFTNAGGSAFPLAPGASTYVVMRLRPGSEFTTADVQRAANPVIRIEAYADDILVGGMSYAIDPNRTGRDEPCNPEPPSKCAETGTNLMHCVDLSHSKVKELRVRKVNVDLVLEDECGC